MTHIHLLDLKPRHPLLPVSADWYPLFINQRYFHDLNVSFRFFSAPVAPLGDCDYIFLSSRYFSLHTQTATQRERCLSAIAALRTPTTKVVWFDFRDSTGNTQFEVLPYVNLYLKKQLLRDLSLYANKYYANRLYTDYIHRTQNVSDDYTDHCEPLLPIYRSKLNISWNPGLLDFRGGLKWRLAKQLLTDRWETLFPAAHHIDWVSPHAYRPYHLLARFNTAYGRQTVSWQRRHAPLLLAKLRDKKIISRDDLSLAEELSYRRQVKLVLSLFGWGELCSRDFQAWIAGAALIAPDTTHLTTFPLTHIPNQTYLPIKWDLSDLVAAYRRLLQDHSLRLSLAIAGQERYRAIWSDQGRQQFVQHFMQILNGVRHSTTAPTTIASSTALM